MSVPGRRRRRSCAEGCIVSGSEAATILSGWPNGWIAEPRMALQVGSQARVNIAARGLDTVVIALLRDRTEFGWRWRRCDNYHRLRMRTAREGNGEQ